jgi:hypothetical protein
MTMTARHSNPERGHDSTESEDEYPPMQDASDIEIALELEGRKQDAKTAINDVCEALLNDDVPLTDEKVGRMWDAASRIDHLCETLVQRVPDEHQIEDR